ncbi:MAG TPA: DNA-formamidopyrimidine glycosylase family protein, partial [Acidimicrobiia bacterium]|nr:DNA-formamidopyrimidine glycosylase family protein [Acidimicrobiia bacterium]
MPELIEVERYRRLAEQALERRIAEVVAPDAWWLKGGLSAAVLSDALLGRHFLAARRTGKRIMLDTSDEGP